MGLKGKKTRNDTKRQFLSLRIACFLSSQHHFSPNIHVNWRIHIEVKTTMAVVGRIKVNIPDDIRIYMFAALCWVLIL